METEVKGKAKKQAAAKIVKSKGNQGNRQPENRVCLVYDSGMLSHWDPKDKNHLERKERISSAFAKMENHNLVQDCLRLDARFATREELELIHDSRYLDTMEARGKMNQSELRQLSSEFKENSIFMCPKTQSAALLAAGSALQVVDSILNGESRSGLAIIRPPGHHAAHDKAFGFCFYNNVALAAKHAVDTHGLERVLIVDWDVHHGDGIQDMFKDDSRVLYVSLHRRDLFPYKDVEGECKGDCSYVGEGNGVGYTMNIAWPEGDMGSAEYLAAFWQLVMPVARQFNPQLVLVAAGFDAAIGDDLGGCKVDPDCYGHLTHLLSSLAQGRVAIFLEGGYNISSVSKSVVMCAKALLGYPLPALAPFTGLRPAAVQTISKSSKAHLPYWSILANKVEHSTQLVVKALSQLSLEPEIRLKKIGPQELAGRVRLGCLNPLDCPPELAEEVASSSVRARNSCPPCASGDEKDAQIQVLEDRVAKLKIRLDETQREIKELQLDNERLRCKN